MTEYEEEIEGQIIYLLRIIETHTGVAEAILPEGLKKLREAIFIVHPQLESDLETLIISSIISPFSRKITFKQFEAMIPVSENLFEGMSFSKKLYLLKSLNILPPTLFDDIKKTNEIRNLFAHPTRNQIKLKKLKNKFLYKEILENLLKSREGLVELLKEKDLEFIVD